MTGTVLAESSLSPMRKFPLAALSFAFLAGCSGGMPRSSVDAHEVPAATMPAPARATTPSSGQPSAAAENAVLERALRQAEAQVVAQQLALEAEIYAREDAERRADEASRCLVGLASVEHDPRGIVIGLSGAELFDAGKSTLRASSRSALDEVANLLLNQNSTHSIVVHAGAAPADAPSLALNAASLDSKLPQARAEAVRAFFIGRGVDASRITTRDSHALTDRVELVLRPPSSSLSASAD